MRRVSDLKQSVKENDTHELVLCVSLPDNERQRDSGGELVAAVGLRETRLSKGEEGRDRMFQLEIHDDSGLDSLFEGKRDERNGEGCPHSSSSRG